MSTRPIVIYRLGSLGDTLVALPCFHQIARTFPDSRRLVLTNEPVASSAPTLESILGPSGLIDGVIPYKVGERSITGLFRVARRLRATGATTLIYLAAGRGHKSVARDVSFFRLCGFKKIIGAPTAADLHDNRFYPAAGIYESEARRLARNLQSLADIDLDDRANWDLRLTDKERAAANDPLAALSGRPLFVINVGGKQAVNHWGGARWKELIERLAQQLGDHSLVTVGTHQDFAPSQALLDSWPSATANLCGLLSPRESAAVISHARFFVGHDSGPLHLAEAVNTPTVGLFGNNNLPGIWHPHGAHHRPLQDLRGVEFIPVEHVFSTVLEIAGRSR